MDRAAESESESVEIEVLAGVGVEVDKMLSTPISGGMCWQEDASYDEG